MEHLTIHPARETAKKLSRRARILFYLKATAAVCLLLFWGAIWALAMFGAYRAGR